MNLLNKKLYLLAMIAFLGLSACDKAEIPTENAPSEGHEHAAKADDHADEKAHAGEQEHGHEEHAHDEHAAKGPTSLDELPEGVNVVQHEMILLNNAMIGVYTMIIANELSGIPAAIHGVHAARELTHGALTGGQYQPPKNSADLEGFEKLDDAFHDDLVKLVKAAQSNDLELTTKTYAEVIQGCTTCHTEYRY